MSDPTLPHQPFLTPAQRRLAGVALTCLSWLFITAFVVGIGFLLQHFVETYSTVIWPLAVSGILSVLLRPLVQVFQDKLKLSRVQAILLLYVLVVAVCLAVSAIILPVIITQLIGMAQAIPGIPSQVHEKFLKFLEDLTLNHPELDQYLEPVKAMIERNFDPSHIDQYTTKAVGAFQDIMKSAPEYLRTVFATGKHIFEMAAATAVIPIYLFYLLASDREFTGDLRQQLTFLRAPLRHDIIFLVTEFVGILVSFFRGQLLIGLILGILKATGFTLIGVKFGLVLGLFFGLLNVVPYLGTILGLCTILPIAFFQQGGGPTLVAMAIGVFLVVQLCEGYVITPKIMGHNTGLHPMVIIISIFFWGEALNGILGMVLAVPLTAFLVVAWRLLRNKYLPKHGTGLTRVPFKRGIGPVDEPPD